MCAGRLLAPLLLLRRRRLCIKLSDERFMLGQTHARLLCPEKSLSFVSRIQFREREPKLRSKGFFSGQKDSLYWDNYNFSYDSFEDSKKLFFPLKILNDFRINLRIRPKLMGAWIRRTRKPLPWIHGVWKLPKMSHFNNTVIINQNWPFWHF